MKHICLLYGKGIASPGITQSMGNALAANGFSTAFIPLKANLSITRAEILSQNPDLILGLDHTGIEELNLPHQTITCSYFVDHPFYFFPANFKPRPNQFFCTMDKYFMEDMEHELNISSFYLPLGFDPQLLSPHFLHTTPQQIFDISFVGSYFGSSISLRQDRQNKLPSFMNLILDRAISLRLATPGASLSSIFRHLFGEHEHIYRSLNSEQKGSLFYFLDREADSSNKERVYQACARFEPAIVGNGAWQSLCKESSHFKGALPYGEQCYEIYRQTKINLILHRPQISQGLNQRLYDMAALKTFFLIDKRDIVQGLLGQDIADCICFDSVETLSERIQYFLTHEHERNDLREAIHVKLKDQHYPNRMQSMMQWLTAKNISGGQHGPA